MLRLGTLKKPAVFFMGLCLAASFSIAYANGDWQLMHSTQSCQKAHMESCTANATKNPIHPVAKKKFCKAIKLKKTPPPKHRRMHKSAKKYSRTIATPKEELDLYNSERNNSTHTDRVMRCCRTIPGKIVACEIVNPSDLVENTCTAIVENLNSCQAYSCQAPAAQDPTIKTQWNIVRKSGDRCVISSTTEDMGIKDINGKTLAITQSCEYDKIGIQALIQKFKDSEKRYFHFSTCEHYEGIYNCSFTSNGKSIRDAKIGS